MQYLGPAIVICDHEKVLEKQSNYRQILLYVHNHISINDLGKSSIKWETFPYDIMIFSLKIKDPQRKIRGKDFMISYDFTLGYHLKRKSNEKNKGILLAILHEFQLY